MNQHLSNDTDTKAVEIQHYHNGDTGADPEY